MVLFLWTGIVCAQKDVTCFMGIPVDGTKSAMIQKLKAKGFKYDSTLDLLTGRFNGYEVMVGVVTHNDKVWRIMLQDKNGTDEGNIKIRFNNLVWQFGRNEKYLAYDKNAILGEDERIGYEMLVNHKRYEAIFLQSPRKMETFSDEERWEILRSLGYEAEDVNTLTEEQKIQMGNEFAGYVLENYWLKKPVWFMIEGSGTNYRILMYYDNEYNKADGEDL